MIRHGLLGAGKFAAIGLAMAAAVVMPVSASAHGWGGHGYHGGYHGSYHASYGGYHGGYYRHGGYWQGGRWIAGAIITGAIVGLVADALSPPPGYYRGPVAYGQPGVVYAQPGVVYQDGPPVVSRTVIYENAPPTRYIRDDGYDRDDGNN